MAKILGSVTEQQEVSYGEIFRFTTGKLHGRPVTGKKEEWKKARRKIMT